MLHYTMVTMLYYNMMYYTITYDTMLYYSQW